MAKRKTPKAEKIVDLVSERPEKVSENQLARLQSTIKTIDQLTTDVGRMEVQKYSLMKAMENIQTRIEVIRKEFNKVGLKYKLETYVSGNAFLTKPGKFSELIKKCVKKITRRSPRYTTDGGTSDARFIKDYTNVVEFGLVGKTMHTNDERVSLKNLKDLTKIYKLVLEEYFK